MEFLSSFSNILVLLVFMKTQFYFAVSQENIIIIRNPVVDGDPWKTLDQFKLPDSKCSDVYCHKWNAHPVSQDCYCECSFRQEATFGFYFGSWKCLANTEVRNQTGRLCKYKFRGENLQTEQDNYPLSILPEGAEANAILPSVGCSVDQATSRYFTCDGRWAGIDSQSFDEWFSIEFRGFSFGAQAIYAVRIGSSISADLQGRIISLNITCPQEHSCLLFKLQGTFLLNTSASGAENVTSVITSPSSAVPSPTTPATDATSASKTSANPYDNGKKENAKTIESSSTVVGVVVALVIIVVIVIVIVIYVHRKRRRGESEWLVDYISSRVRNIRSTHPKKKTMTEEKQEDPEYAEIPEEQRRNEPINQGGAIYSYAFDDPQTAYIAPKPPPYNRMVHNRQGPDEEGAIYSTADDAPSYNALERSPAAENHITMAPESTMNPNIAPQPAPYNRLVHNRQGPDEEGAIYSTADDGPVYNVLERPPVDMAPESTMNNEPASQDLEPEYQVLEVPDTTDETTVTPFHGNTDIRASIGSANPGGPQTGHVAPNERRKLPSPPRKK